MPTRSPKLNMMIPSSKQLIIGIIGLFMAICGAVYMIFSEKIFNYMLHKYMVLQPSMPFIDFWEKPPINATVSVYFFNWTNPEDFNNPAIKPRVEEVGPYKFTEVSKKSAVQWHPENASVTYRRDNLYYYDPIGSRSFDDDRIVAINILGMGIASIASNQLNGMRRSLINMALNMYGYDMVTTHSPREMLFEGYRDPIMDITSIVPSSLTNVNIPLTRFGYGHGRNGTSKFYGLLNMFTGADDISKLGKVHTWNNRTINPAYEYSETKVPVAGSGGDFQQPNLKKNEPIGIFVPDVCRPITFEYDSEVKHEGITQYKYKTGLRAIDNGTLYPEMKSYCNGKCVPAGLMNITSCLYGMPAFLSYPHLYMADPFYANQVDGQYPDKEKHDSEIFIDPKTGFTTELTARLQVNLHVYPTPAITMFRNVREMFMPMLWFEYRVKMNDDLLWYMRMIPVTEGLSFCMSLLSVFGGLYLFTRMIHQLYQKQTQRWHPTEKALGKEEFTIKLPDFSPLLATSQKYADQKMEQYKQSRAPEGII